MMENCEISGYQSNREGLTIIDTWDRRFEIAGRIRDKLDFHAFRLEFIRDQDWNKTWIDGFQALEVTDNIWIAPPWHRNDIPDHVISVLINPGQAFGTGSHESTRLTLDLMSRYLKKGQALRDLGCGSGILSIAAEKMGAGSIHACDADPVIKENLLENIKLNHCNRIKWEIADVLKMNDYSCNLAVINIQKHIILPLLDRFSRRDKIPEMIILSGLLTEHGDEVYEHLESSIYMMIEYKTKNDWMAIAARRRS